MGSILDQALKTYRTQLVGGNGSTQDYTIVSKQQTPPAPVQSIIFYTNKQSQPGSGSYIQSISATFADGSSGTAVNSPTSYPNSFVFEDGEVLDQCTLYFVSFSDGRAGISFTTNFGRSFSAGDTTSAGTQLAVKGSQIYGLFGFDGSAVDAMGLIVDLPILEIEINNLDYALSDATPSILGPIAVDSVVLSNDTTTAQTVSVVRSFTVTNTSTWSIAAGMKLGAKATIETGIPFILKGNVEISAELSFTYTYGRTYTTTQTFQYAAGVSVPAGQQVTAEVTATQGNLSVDYTGTLQVWYADGTTASFDLSGTYAGITSYDIVVTYSQPEAPAQIEARRAQQIVALQSTPRQRLQSVHAR